MNKPAILTSAVNHGPNHRQLLNAVNAASESAQAGWIVLLGLTAYYVVALGGVTDRDLLLNSPIVLPILGISVSLYRFFFFAPLIYIFLHLGVLVHHVGLVRKIYALIGFMETQEISEVAATGKPFIHPLRYEVSGNFFTQFLAGPPESGLIRFFQQMMVWSTLVLLPLAVLLAFQIGFLPYHDVTATWLHRSYVALALIIVAFVGVFLPSSEQSFWRALGAGLSRYPGFYAITAFGFAVISFLAFAVATVPGEWIDRTLARPGLSIPAGGGAGGETAQQRPVFAPTALLFEGTFDPATGRPRSIFHRNLVVIDDDVATKDAAQGRTTIALRYRDLRFARLDRSDLHGADLTCADMTDAVLTGTNLEGAKTGCPS